MMGPGMGDHGMMGHRFGMEHGFSGQALPSRDLSTEDVRHFLEHHLEWHGNKRLKLGEVKQTDDDTILAEITTLDGSLVERLEVDRHTGRMHSVE